MDMLNISSVLNMFAVLNISAELNIDLFTVAKHIKHMKYLVANATYFYFFILQIGIETSTFYIQYFCLGVAW